jgi:hypothetical protein
MLSPILYLNTAPSAVQSPLAHFVRRGDDFAFQSFRCSSEFLRKFRHPCIVNTSSDALASSKHSRACCRYSFEVGMSFR